MTSPALPDVSGSLDGATALIIDLDNTLIDATATRAEAFAAVDRIAFDLFGTEPGGVVEHADSVLQELWGDSPFAEEFSRLGFAATDVLWADFDGADELLAEVRRWMPGFRTRFWKTLCARADGRRCADDAVLASAFVAERRARIRTFPGVLDALSVLRAKFPLALLTNGPGCLQRLKLRRTGLDAFFGPVVVSGEAGVAKPNPEIFAIACRAIGSPAGSTVMIGDDWKADVQGAHRAGLAAILIRGGAPIRAAQSAAAGAEQAPVVQRFSDLPQFLERDHGAKRSNRVSAKPQALMPNQEHWR